MKQKPNTLEADLKTIDKLAGLVGVGTLKPLLTDFFFIQHHLDDIWPNHVAFCFICVGTVIAGSGITIPIAGRLYYNVYLHTECVKRLAQDKKIMTHVELL